MEEIKKVYFDKTQCREAVSIFCKEAEAELEI